MRRRREPRGHLSGPCAQKFRDGAAANHARAGDSGILLRAYISVARHNIECRITADDPLLQHCWADARVKLPRPCRRKLSEKGWHARANPPVARGLRSSVAARGPTVPNTKGLHGPYMRPLYRSTLYTCLLRASSPRSDRGQAPRGLSTCAATSDHYSPGPTRENPDRILREPRKHRAQFLRVPT